MEGMLAVFLACLLDPVLWLSVGAVVLFWRHRYAVPVAAVFGTGLVTALLMANGGGSLLNVVVRFVAALLIAFAVTWTRDRLTSRPAD